MIIAVLAMVNWRSKRSAQLKVARFDSKTRTRPSELIIAVLAMVNWRSKRSAQLKVERFNSKVGTGRVK
ncbi:hypothetical protein [Lactiplantibacillus pentosus]|uniref:hypothetical protein n=1 Tax=Lactiplantibacillus pentosus TaxID=1589 RepID=UPI00207AFA39|nr:hypothetical protein [Lactiplantibacillus pentosus]USJ87279.1 hypothetical protein KSF55_05490 [Lactiplantibacillus pentosus]